MTSGALVGHHKCPKVDCPRFVKNTQYACPRHWFQVSQPVRRRISRAWATGDLDAHYQAMIDAEQELNG